MPSLRILPVIIIGGLLLASCGGTEAPTPAPVPTLIPSAIDAGELYAGNCVVCHGEKRQGVSGLGPALIPESLAALSDIEVRDTILSGRPGTAMAGWQERLSPKEIDALLQLIKYTSP